MKQKMLLAAGILGSTAVIIGAFGAHALRDILTDHQLSIYQTGVQYQFIHALALLGLASRRLYTEMPGVRIAAGLFILGTAFFSGSLYLLAMTDILGIGALGAVIGPLTPIGGVMFVIGWAIIFFGAFRTERVY